MRLPEDEKERAKVLVLISLGTIAVIYTVLYAVVRPLRIKRAERADEITAVQQRLEEAEREVGRMMKNRKENTQILRKVIELANAQKSVLQPRLGNYRLEARDFLESHASTASVEIDDIRQVGIIQLPKSEKQETDNVLKAYISQVKINGGLHDLIRFLRQIEVSNPFLVVSSLSITSLAATPGKHSITVELQWPVWADEKLGQELEARLKELLEFKVPVGRPKVPTKKMKT